MPNYKGKRPGTRRVVIWDRGKAREWIVPGTKRDADMFESEKRLELRVRAGAAERRVAARFSELAEEYRVHAKTHLKKSTWSSRKHHVAALVGEMGDVLVTELGPGHVELHKKHRLEDGLEASSVNNELRTLGTMLGFGRDMGHRIPVFKWKRLRQRAQGRARAFTDEEIGRLWASCRARSPRLLPKLVFLVNTGCRKGEAIAAEWSWMDFDASMIRIPSSQHWTPKNGKPREVPMSDAVRAVLGGPAELREHPRWVFPSLYGGPLNAFPRESWEAVLEHAKLTGGVHQLRHTFASHFLRQIPDLRLLGLIMGHSTQRMTELYLHLLPGQLDHARNAVNLGPQTMAVTMAAGGGRNRK
jgi:integrase